MDNDDDGSYDNTLVCLKIEDSLLPSRPSVYNDRDNNALPNAIRALLFSYKPMCSRLYGYEKALTFRCKHENMGTPGSCAVRKTLVQDSAEQNRQPPSRRPHGSFMEHMQALASVAQVSYWLAANAYIRKVPGDM